MATKRKCATATCNNLVRVKYRYCDTCRDAGVTTTTQPNPNDVILDPIAVDREKLKTTRELATVKSKYADSLKIIEQLESEIATFKVLHDNIDPSVIEPKFGQGTSECSVVWVASDWHVEERVGPELGILNNRFDLEMADKRITQFWQAGLRLTQLLNKDVKIPTVVLALLGDFISGDIHEEVSEVCQLPPMEAILFAQNRIISGIEFVLDHSKYNLVIVCHSGNHARTTHTTRFATENGHSLEYLMYHTIKMHFHGNKRVTVIVPEGPHSYLDIYGINTRFQHGHMIKYGGGVGGLTIPANKAIAQWDRAVPTQLNVFGHFHQQFDGGNFICNGSLIGYNSFAMSIKAAYDDPKQTLFMLDKKRGRTCLWPILLEKK